MEMETVRDQTSCLGGRSNERQEEREEEFISIKILSKRNQKLTISKSKFHNSLLLCKLLSIAILNNILSDLIYNHQHNLHLRNHHPLAQINNPFKLPTVLFADAIECSSDYDCGRDKVCHENKCICSKDRPIEDQDRCLPVALINEQCAVSEQCLGNSKCVEGICSCGNEAISLFNPSSKILYCHPKRGLNEECNFDSQCPTNSYCSTEKSGCLCQNGYAEATVSTSGQEVKECLPILCTNSATCDLEYHRCEDDMCKCLPTHFDPTTAKCYKFGSTQGKSAIELLLEIEAANNNNSTVNLKDNNDNIYKTFKDLMENGDKTWLVLIILISLSLLILILIFILMRKYYLGYCWTAHKKEYEPNNKTTPKNGYFNKNSINNKSFRQKSSGEVDDLEAEGADKSNLVPPTSKSSNGDKTNNKSRSVFSHKQHGATRTNDYVKVNINDKNETSYESNDHQQVVSPLSTSTSTPV